MSVVAAVLAVVAMYDLTTILREYVTLSSLARAAQQAMDMSPEVP